MRVSLPIKLMASYVLVAALIVAPSLWFLRRSLVNSLVDAAARELDGRVEAVRDRLASAKDQEIEEVVRETARLLQLRVTYVDRSGQVRADSEIPRQRLPLLENHLIRPEVATAMAGGYGFAQRTSTTLGAELIYGALPLISGGTIRGVVRVAQRVGLLEDAVSNALLAPRLAAGVAMSAAIGLSLIAALFLAIPLRRMRDAARAFADGKWVTFRRVRTRDELEELSVALEELGQKLQKQLVDVGAQDALLTQAILALPLPALILDHEQHPVCINGAFRHFAGLTAANEVEHLTALTHDPRLLAARERAERSGASAELLFAPPGTLSDAPRKCLLSPLARPGSPPLWLLLTDLQLSDADLRGAEAIHRLLHSAEAVLEKLWEANPTQRTLIAQLRQRLDEAAFAAGRPEASGVQPIGAADLINRCADEVRALHPELGKQLVLDFKHAPCAVAESSGMAARAVRTFLAGALRALPPGRSLAVTLRTEPSEVKLFVEGAAPIDLDGPRELARALGTDVGRVPTREREMAWLGLPRA